MEQSAARSLIAVQYGDKTGEVLAIISLPQVFLNQRDFPLRVRPGDNARVAMESTSTLQTKSLCKGLHSQNVRVERASGAHS
jgi:hypothetical protein